MKRALPTTLALAFLAACGTKPSSNGQCVYNHAYQENFQPDSVATLLDKADGCYVLLDPDEPGAAEAIPSLHDAGNTVGCYTSVGTCEDWRADFDAVAGSCVDEQWGAWAGEYFLDTPDTAWRSAMTARLSHFAELGCDAVEFDNMDWAFDAHNRDRYGFSITAAEAETYIADLCAEAESLGLGCMAKNTTRGMSSAMGGTFESYPSERNWWDRSELQGLLDDGMLGVIVHYGEWDCDAVFEDYLDLYGNQLSFVCESRDTRGYVHYNDGPAK